MSRLLLLLVAFVGVCAAVPQYSYNTDFEPDLSFSAFTEYTHTFNKKYSNVEEFIERFGNFKASVKRIAERNKDGRNVYGLNKLSDLSTAEFKATHLGFDPKLQSSLPKAQVAAGVFKNATSYDWRTKGAVTPVKDQGQCGSCWAFSATEEIESCWFLAGNELVALSAQESTSCSEDDGCEGGWPMMVYQWTETNGLVSDADYPYVSGTEGDQACSVTGDVVAKITDFSYAIPPCQDECTNQDEQTMANVLSATAPLSVCVDAESWQDYSSGIITDNCPSDYSELDHCVQAVGFDQSGSTPYWVVRNSWAEDWGEEGYIRVAMGSNLCGIGDLATYVHI